MELGAEFIDENCTPDENAAAPGVDHRSRVHHRELHRGGDEAAYPFDT